MKTSVTKMIAVLVLLAIAAVRAEVPFSLVLLQVQLCPFSVPQEGSGLTDALGVSYPCRTQWRAMGRCVWTAVRGVRGDQAVRSPLPLWPLTGVVWPA
jgi:hypothetical protein